QTRPRGLIRSRKGMLSHMAMAVMEEILDMEEEDSTDDEIVESLFTLAEVIQQLSARGHGIRIMPTDGQGQVGENHPAAPADMEEEQDPPQAMDEIPPPQPPPQPHRRHQE